VRWARSREQASAPVGIVQFRLVGNKLDVSSNDLLCYFERDERTSVIALYLESLGIPGSCANRPRVGARKPIVALKAGRTTAGVRVLDRTRRLRRRPTSR